MEYNESSICFDDIKSLIVFFAFGSLFVAVAYFMLDGTGEFVNCNSNIEMIMYLILHVAGYVCFVIGVILFICFFTLLFCISYVYIAEHFSTKVDKIKD